MGQTKGVPPRETTLVYNYIAGSHTFYSRDVPGLAVGSEDLREAFDLAIEGLGFHVGKAFDVTVSYDAKVSFEQFEASIKNAGGLSKIGVPLRSRIHNEARCE